MAFFNYFREIAQRSEAEFVTSFREQTEEAYIQDLLTQAWRNSQILTEKFNHLSKAFLFLAWAIIPWLIVLAILSARTAETAIKQ